MKKMIMSFMLILMVSSISVQLIQAERQSTPPTTSWVVAPSNTYAIFNAAFSDSGITARGSLILTLRLRTPTGAFDTLNLGISGIPTQPPTTGTSSVSVNNFPIMVGSTPSYVQQISTHITHTSRSPQGVSTFTIQWSIRVRGIQSGVQSTLTSTSYITTPNADWSQDYPHLILGQVAHQVTTPGTTTAWAPRTSLHAPSPTSKPNSYTDGWLPMHSVTVDRSTPAPDRFAQHLTWWTGRTLTIMTNDPGSGLGNNAIFSHTGTGPLSLGSAGYAYIGQWTPTVTARDREGDATSTQLQIRVRTSMQLPLRIEYGDQATLPVIRGLSYDAFTQSLPCGGEWGWTNQPLTFIAGDDIISGMWGNDFARVLESDMPGFATRTSTTGPARFDNYRQNTPAASHMASAVATVIGQPSVRLSGQTFRSYRIDITPPVASVSHGGGTTFTCTSTDALSGLSLRADRRTRVALVVGLGTPADSDYHFLDSVPTMPGGTYSLWVWATDMAGNEHKVRQSTTFHIEGGGVSVSKDTDAGATVHVEDCPNHNQITTFIPCTTDCQIGTRPELMGGTEVTYILKLKNNDTATTATGTFNDVLPAGFVPIGLPTTANLSGTGSIAGVNSNLSGNRYTITGNYTLGGNAEMEIRIRGTMPAYDTSAGATNLVQNQASITWQIGTDNGTAESNYANHRINEGANIHKVSNWGAASHAASCANADSLTLVGTCHASCTAGNPGTVQKGDLITYQLTFSNPSNALLYFATDALANYDLMPASLNMSGQSYSVSYTDQGGTTTTPWSGNVSTTGTILNQASPYGDGTFVGGLTLQNNRIFQQANSSISIAPKSTLVITVTATVDGDVDVVLTNQMVSGFSITGSNTENLRTTQAGVETIRSNYVTHQIEAGTSVQKWVYSDTPAANDPAIHAPFCANADSMLTAAGCTMGVCANGTASLKGGDSITYALHMDNSQSSRVARDLNGTVLDMGSSGPGNHIEYNHIDNVIPQGLTPDVTTLRAYVTDKNGNNVSTTNGLETSSLQAVNENGSSQMREVIKLSVGTNDIHHAGNASSLFQLQNLDLQQVGTQWSWSTTNRHIHKRGSTHDQGTFSITYLFDAEVTGEYDSNVLSNNVWKNYWEQHNPWIVNNPETGVAVIPAQTLLRSNSVLQARMIDGVDTSFTKVAADDLTLALAGAEFALYRWNETTEPNETQRNHMVDASLLIDNANNTLGGDWIRVAYNGVVATSTNEIFVSKATPLGEVDFGKLAKGVYTLIEIKAPAGYEKPVGQWILTIDPLKDDSGDGNYKIEFVGKSNSMMPPATIRDVGPTYRLINARPFSIGMSGLAGTRGLLLAGFVMMSLAGNAYIAYSYKQRKNRMKK